MRILWFVFIRIWITKTNPCVSVKEKSRTKQKKPQGSDDLEQSCKEGQAPLQPETWGGSTAAAQDTTQFVFGSGVTHSKVLPAHQHSLHSAIHPANLLVRGWMGRHQHSPGHSSAAALQGLEQEQDPPSPELRAQICHNLGEHPFHPCCSPLQEPLLYPDSSASNKEMTLLLCRQISKDSRRLFPHKTEGGKRGHPAQGPPERAEVSDSSFCNLNPHIILQWQRRGGKWDVSCACPGWVWQRPKNLKTRRKAT